MALIQKITDVPLFSSLIARIFASPYILGALLILVTVGGYLGIRKWADRRTERNQDTEIVRENEEYLGSWAQKSDGSFIRFRLQRDGGFLYKLVQYPGRDTTTINGSYAIVTVSGNSSTDQYPRLIAVSDQGDTIINHYIAYITPYDVVALDGGYDKMVLNPGGRLDTTGLAFFRIK
ncbi:hypothetical protein LL912_18735 [Niabella sp. CC-SYL272]|uniref:hypothetical protein n=1 Tax=Niabella agricola TaxID=2891571 RepID=UPI001F48BBD7|nr:hypothetical protein [Niabella agricola]MCF3110828.1 hypothetical protein [Niabella agricola]